MFGDGIYLADASSKSAGYCGSRGPFYYRKLMRNTNTSTHFPGGANEEEEEEDHGMEAVLLLCEADVGAREERVRTLHSLPDGHEVVRECRRLEDRRREMEAWRREREEEVQREMAREEKIQSGEGLKFEWKKREEEEGDDGGVSTTATATTTGDNNVWLYWQTKGKGGEDGKGHLKQGGQQQQDSKDSTATAKRRGSHGGGAGIGTGVRCIEGVGKTGPKDEPDGWKKVGWRLDWDWTKSGSKAVGSGQNNTSNDGSDYGDVWMVSLFVLVLEFNYSSNFCLSYYIPNPFVHVPKEKTIGVYFCVFLFFANSPATTNKNL